MPNDFPIKDSNEVISNLAQKFLLRIISIRFNANLEELDSSQPPQHATNPFTPSNIWLEYFGILKLIVAQKFPFGSTAVVLQIYKILHRILKQICFFSQFCWVIYKFFRLLTP